MCRHESGPILDVASIWLTTWNATKNCFSEFGPRLTFIEHLLNIAALYSDSRHPVFRAGTISSIAKRLLHLSANAVDFHGTVDHDHLCSLLGLLGTQDLPMELNPDYRLPVADVFKLHQIYHPEYPAT